MATRSGTNKGIAALRGSHNEFLRFRLVPQGLPGFAQADDATERVVSHLNFGGADELVWRLQASTAAGGTRIVATDDHGHPGTPIPPYSRIATAIPIPVYSIALVFVTAVGYKLTIDRCAADGTVISNIADVTYKDGTPGDSSATEAVSLDLGQA